MTHGKASSYKRGCHCPECTEAQRVKQSERRARVAPKVVRSPRTTCRRSHALTPENTVTLANGYRRCRTCNRQREKWRSHGGSLAKAIAWAKATCGPEAPSLTDDEWERILRTQVFGQERIVRSVILLPNETLNTLADRRGGIGVDSLGVSIAPGEAWCA